MTPSPRSREAQLEQLIAQMPQELMPLHDLWPQIERRMDKPQHLKAINNKAVIQPNARFRFALFNQWAVAATVLVAVLLGIHSSTRFPLITPWQQSQTANQDPALQALLTQIAQTHNIQVQSLEHSPNAPIWQTSRMGAPLEQGLAELRQAGTQIYQALQANPTDKQLWQLWLWVQQRELELLQQGQKLPLKIPTQGNTL